MKQPAAPIKPMSRTAIRRALKTPGFVLLQFCERHGLAYRTVMRMKKKKTEYPPTERTLRKFTLAIQKDRAAGLLGDE